MTNTESCNHKIFIDGCLACDTQLVANLNRQLDNPLITPTTRDLTYKLIARVEARIAEAGR
jgi:hypothetical protein